MKAFLHIALVLSLVFMPGCVKEQTDMEVVERTYQFLQVSSVVYDTTMQVAEDAHANGLLNHEQWDKVKAAGTVYYDSYQAVVTALGIYMELIEDLEGHHYDRAQLKILLTECSKNLTVLVSELKELGIAIRGANDGN